MAFLKNTINDLSRRIEKAANNAISTLGLQDVEYDGLTPYKDSDRLRIHFKRNSRYFSIGIMLGGHSERPGQASVSVLAKQIEVELAKRRLRN